jgi:hypothetical protein
MQQDGLIPGFIVRYNETGRAGSSPSSVKFSQKTSNSSIWVEVEKRYRSRRWRALFYTSGPVTGFFP